MTKKVEKKFWVSGCGLEKVKYGIFPSTGLCIEKTPVYCHAVTISYEVPDRKITISESEFAKKMEEIYDYPRYEGLLETVKFKLFGGGE